MRNSRVSIQLHNLVVVLICGAITLFVCSPVSATIITNVTTGTPLFYDDFEGLGTAVSHAAYPDTGGDYDPDNGLNPGSWYIIGEDSPARVQVTDHTGGVDPGAFQGSNYLRLVRELAGSANGFGLSRHTNQNTAGDHIRLETMIYLSTVSGTQMDGLGYLGNSQAARIWLQLDPVNGVVQTHNGSGYVDIDGLSVTGGKWQKYTLDYNIGDTTFGLGIDGTYVSDIPTLSSGDVERLGFYPDLQRGTIYPMYVDDIYLGPIKPGDCNSNGIVDEEDAAILASNWLESGSHVNWGIGDFDGDLKVNDIDATLMAANWQGSAASTAVPEPGTILMLASLAALLGITLWLRRR